MTDIKNISLNECLETGDENDALVDTGVDVRIECGAAGGVPGFW